MRVTNSMVLTSTLRDLSMTQSKLQLAQADLSTGRAIRKASDDPAKASAAMALHNQLRRSEHRSRALADAQAWLNTADSALTNGLDLVNRAKELAVRGASTGINDTNARQAIATELSGIRDELLAIANTRYLDRSIFNGTVSGDAYDATGTYLGNAAQVMREIGPGTTVQVNMTGEEIFGTQSAPEGDLFAVIDRLQAAVITGDPTTISAEHANLDAARTRMATATAQLGARGARMETVKGRASADELSMRSTLSEIEDVDLAEALMNVKNRELAYNAALGSAAKVIPNSLLDYLR